MLFSIIIIIIIWNHFENSNCSKISGNKKTGEEALARVNVSVCSATDGLINAATCFKLAPIFDLSSFLLTLKRGISYPAVAAYWGQSVPGAGSP